MVCILCLNETNDGISIYGDSEAAENARLIIVKYFWFRIDEINTSTNYACSECWEKVESFHEFSRTIELIHKRRSYNDETGAVQLNPLSNFGSDNEPEYKSILIPLPIVVEQLPEIAENSNYNGYTTAENDPIEDAYAEDNNVSFIEEAIASKGSQNGKSKRSRPARIIDKFVCYMCHKQFKSIRTLRNHFDLHDPIECRTFECKLCDRKFSRELMLKNHILLHGLRKKKAETARTKTKCPLCQKSLSNGALWQHMRTVHDDKKSTETKFICETCGKKCSDLTALRQHTVTHVDRSVTKVQCETCGKWFKNQCSLRTHKTLHQQSAHKCPHCDVFKPNLQQLRQHIVVCHETPTHKCNFCYKSFSREKSLREHIATHTKQALYKCRYCKDPFKNDANMYKHLRLFHAEQWNLDRAKKLK